MQRVVIFTLLATSVALAQPETNHIFVRSGGATIAGFQGMSSGSVAGAPYLATITNESIQTLADGNRIVQTSTGTTARDSMGRTRQDAPLPAIGNLKPAEAPHLVLLQDPVAQVSYTLNLTDKTAMKGPGFYDSSIPAGAGQAIVSIKGVATGSLSAVAAVAPPPPPLMIAIPKSTMREQGHVQTEDLGSQTMEGVLVTGIRVTNTIPAGQIGNDKPINIVTEVWTSPELKTVVYSKRSDPRMGDQTFKLTNIMRAEPDPSLFTVPADFRILDTPEPIVYKTSGGPAQ